MCADWQQHVDGPYVSTKETIDRNANEHSENRRCAIVREQMSLFGVLVVNILLSLLPAICVSVHNKAFREPDIN